MIEPQLRFEREPAKRVFAAELREATKIIKDESDEKSPYYLLLPTGERCNRILIAGTLTEKTKVGDVTITYRAKLSDPTGIFYISASTFQTEAMSQMAKIDGDKPTFVMVIGKPNAYTPPNGKTFISIRAEAVLAIDRETRDMWVADTAKATLKRIKNMTDENENDNPDIALARESYPQSPDTWKRIIFDAISAISS